MQQDKDSNQEFTDLMRANMLMDPTSVDTTPLPEEQDIRNDVIRNVETIGARICAVCVEHEIDVQIPWIVQGRSSIEKAALRILGRRTCQHMASKA